MHLKKVYTYTSTNFKYLLKIINNYKNFYKISFLSILYRQMF